MDRPTLILKETHGAQIRGLDASHAGITHSASHVVAQAPADKKAKTVSESTHIQTSGTIEKGPDSRKLECQPCQTMNDIRMYYCQNSKPLMGSAREAKDGLKRLAASVALRMGFAWRPTTRGLLSKAGEETSRALKHGKHRDRCRLIMDRYAKGEVRRPDGLDQRKHREDSGMGRVV